MSANSHPHRLCSNDHPCRKCLMRELLKGSEPVFDPPQRNLLPIGAWMEVRRRVETRAEARAQHISHIREYFKNRKPAQADSLDGLGGEYVWVEKDEVNARVEGDREQARLTGKQKQQEDRVESDKSEVNGADWPRKEDSAGSINRLETEAPREARRNTVAERVVTEEVSRLDLVPAYFRRRKG